MASLQSSRMLAAPRSAASAPPGAARDAVLVALVATLAWLWIRTDAFHGLDVHQFTAALARGQFHHPNHVLYLRIAGPPALAIHELLGLRIDQGLAIVSAAGSGIAVGLAAYAASLLGARRRDAALVALLVARPQGVTWFATVAEVPGVLLPFAALAFVAWAAFDRRATIPRALALGATVGVAASVHASGHLLGVTVSLLTLARTPRRLPGRRAGRLALVVVAWAAVAATTRIVLRSGAEGRPGLIDFVLGWAAERAPWDDLPTVLGNEWLLPFLPIGSLALLAMLPARTRAAAIATALATAVHLTVAVLLLDGSWSERGAYLLPLAIPYAMLTVDLLPAPAACAAAICGGIVTVVVYLQPAAEATADRWAGDLAAAIRSAEQPVVVVTGEPREADAIIRVAPRLTWMPVYELLGAVAAEQGATLESWFARQHAQLDAFGSRLWITAGAMDVFGDIAPDFVDDTLQRRYALEPVRHGTFRGLDVRRR